MMKYILILLFVVISFWFTLPAFAIVCHDYDGHEICILSIKRSAKKYWEYRASVSVDGVKTPVEIYNCRGKFKLKKDGKVEQFTEHSAGKMICSFFKK